MSAAARWSASTALCVLSAAALHPTLEARRLASPLQELRTLHVAVSGKDGGDGSARAPFATLARARDAARVLLAAGQAVEVRVAPGVYELRQPLVLGPEDSGTAAAPVRWLAQPGAVLRGGPRVRHWRPVTDAAILARLPEESRETVRWADLAAQGVTDYGELAPRGMGRPRQPSGLELFVAGRPMTLARWPNEGWARIAGVPGGAGGGRFTFAGERPARWLEAPDPWLHGYWTWGWADSYERLASIDLDAHALVTAPPHGVYGYKKGGRYRALNLLEELDAPGEWYLDRETGALFLWPDGDLNENEAVVSVATNLVECRDASYVVLAGFDLEAARGTGILVRGGAQVTVRDCRLRNLGVLGVDVDGGTGHRVLACEICGTGEGGIRLSGGERASLTPGGHLVRDVVVHHFSRWVRTYRPAIDISGVGNRIAHVHLYDGPHCAILLHGNEHVIELSEIDHVCAETDDVGAFYMGRDYTQRGNVVRFNYFHDLGRDPGAGGVGSMAIYLDDFTSGTLVEGNLCVRAGRAVLVGGGRDNTIRGNVFVDCTPAVHVDSRGLGWARTYFDGTLTTLQDRMRAVHASEPPYSTRYPELVDLFADEPALAKGNVVAQNVCSGGRWLDLRDGLTEDVVHLERNLTGTDPRFADPAHDDYHLRPDSPAWALGFEALPLECIGPGRPDPPRDPPEAPH